MTFRVSTVEGKSVVTDENGVAMDWVHAVLIDLKPGYEPLLYLGTYDFAIDTKVGPSVATNPFPAPAKAAAPRVL